MSDSIDCLCPVCRSERRLIEAMMDYSMTVYEEEIASELFADNKLLWILPTYVHQVISGEIDNVAARPVCGHCVDKHHAEDDEGEGDEPEKSAMEIVY